MSYIIENVFWSKVASSARFTISKVVRENLGLCEGDIVRVSIESVRTYRTEECVHAKRKIKTKFEKNIDIAPELLLALLHGNKYTVHKVAEIFKCGDVTIREGMKVYGIPEVYHRDEEHRLSVLCECNRRCRLAENMLLEDFTKEAWLDKVLSTDGICSVCGRSYMEGGGLTLDHIMPVSRAPLGFIYTIDDVQPMCRSCNSHKRDSIVLST